MIKRGQVFEIYQDGKTTWLGMATQDQNKGQVKMQFLNIGNALDEAIEDLYEVVDTKFELDEKEIVADLEGVLIKL